MKQSAETGKQLQLQPQIKMSHLAPALEVMLLLFFSYAISCFILTYLYFVVVCTPLFPFVPWQIVVYPCLQSREFRILACLLTLPFFLSLG